MRVCVCVEGDTEREGRKANGKSGAMLHTALLLLTLLHPLPPARVPLAAPCRSQPPLAIASDHTSSRKLSERPRPSSKALLDGDADEHVDDEHGGLAIKQHPQAAAVLLMLVFWSWPWALSFILSRVIPVVAPIAETPSIVSAPSAALLAAITFMSRQLDMLETVASRLLVAAGCGAIIGVERKDADRPAGLRSMTLVSSGSALYTLACIFGIEGGDPVRAAAQVCTGVGFIGAGVIAKGSVRDPVRGVTTACAVWVSAALGVVAASGMWLFALYSTGISISILRISRW